MQTVTVNFNGQHQLIIPDGDAARCCAAEVVQGLCYPFPVNMDPRVVVDIGAHVGEYTLMAALLWPQATIHAFEPFPMAAAVLRENMAKFANVVIHEAAVSRHSGVAKLHVSGYGTVCNSIHPEQMADPTGEIIEVGCLGAADIAALQPDVLKLDCEGAEREIFAAFQQKEIERIARIQLEYHREHDRVAICRRLDETHDLEYVRVLRIGQGELTYMRKG